MKRIAAGVAVALTVAACGSQPDYNEVHADAREAVQNASPTGRVELCDQTRPDEARVRWLTVKDWWLEEGPVGSARPIKPEVVETAIRALDAECAREGLL